MNNKEKNYSKAIIISFEDWNSDNLEVKKYEAHYDNDGNVLYENEDFKKILETFIESNKKRMDEMPFPEIEEKTVMGTVIKVTRGMEMGTFGHTDYHVRNKDGEEYIVAEFDEVNGVNFLALYDSEYNPIQTNRKYKGLFLDFITLKGISRNLALLGFGLKSMMALFDAMNIKYKREELIEYLNEIYDLF